MHRKYLRQYLRKYWRYAKNTANIGANICGEKSENIRTANICANICANIYGKKAKNTYGSLLFIINDRWCHCFCCNNACFNRSIHIRIFVTLQELRILVVGLDDEDNTVL